MKTGTARDKHGKTIKCRVFPKQSKYHHLNGKYQFAKGCNVEKLRDQNHHFDDSLVKEFFESARTSYQSSLDDISRLTGSRLKKKQTDALTKRIEECNSRIAKYTPINDNSHNSADTQQCSQPIMDDASDGGGG